MIRFWRLSEAGEDNLGLACSANGLELARTPLIERHGDSFVVRQRDEIERLLSRAYRCDFTADRLMPALAVVAAALNTNDRCLAHIAAVHLRLPDVPNQTARQDMEAADFLIKLTRDASSSTLEPPRRWAGPTLEIRKASPNDPKHPGWPAGTEGGLGGKFRPKDGSEAASDRELGEIVARRAIRIVALAVLSLAGESVAEAIPGVDFAATAAMSASMAKLISEFRQLKIDTDAATEFVNDGPHSFEDLQVSAKDYREFSSYEAFYKSRSRVIFLAKWANPAGDGSQYHHIVTQGGANGKNFSPEQLQNTDNIIILPKLLHEAVNAEYLKEQSPDPDLNMYDWLQTQPYEVQFAEGLKILRRLHILK